MTQVISSFDQDRKFGVEIETARSGMERRIAQSLNEAGIACTAEGYNHQTRSYWKVVPDASTGSEVVSPPLSGQAGLDEVKKVVEVLRAIGCTVDSSTGLHVHHDARDLSARQIKSVLYLGAKMQAVTDALLPTRVDRWACHSNDLEQMTRNLVRNHSRFISSLYRSEEQRVAGAITGGDRYYAINPTSYLSHGTIEFRQHSGSLNTTKVLSWIVFTQNIVNTAMVKNTSSKPIASQNADIAHLLWSLGSDAHCELTRAARRNIVRRIYVNNPRINLGSAKRYLTREQRAEVRRSARDLAAQHAWIRDYVNAGNGGSALHPVTGPSDAELIENDTRAPFAGPRPEAQVAATSFSTDDPNARERAIWAARGIRLNSQMVEISE